MNYNQLVSDSNKYLSINPFLVCVLFSWLSSSCLCKSTFAFHFLVECQVVQIKNWSNNLRLEMKLASSTVTSPILLETLCLGWWWLVAQSLSHVQFFVTPWAVAYQAPLSGILQARVLEWVAISFSRRSSRPRDRMCFSCVSCLAGRIFTTKSQGKPSFLGWLLIVHQDVVRGRPHLFSQLTLSLEYESETLGYLLAPHLHPQWSLNFTFSLSVIMRLLIPLLFRLSATDFPF